MPPRPPPSCIVDRRRRARRPVPGAGAEAGARRCARGRDVRPGPAPGPAPATGGPTPSPPRRGACSRRSASGPRSRRGGAADPRHGDHRRRLHDPVRPVFLTFEGEVEAGEPFAHMVEGGDLTAALVAACREAGVGLKPAGVEGFEPPGRRRSRSRSPARSAVRGRPPRRGRRRPLEAARGRPGSAGSPGPTAQSGIVATIGHERDHEGRAVEHFLPSGPFAILPLQARRRPLGHRSSIVWTERSGGRAASARARRRTISWPSSSAASACELGRLALETKPQAHPLSFGVARRFVAERLALLGDAAHVIHPIAGQGLNLGLHDAAALAEVVTDAVRLGLDPGGADVLEALRARAPVRHHRHGRR